MGGQRQDYSVGGSFNAIRQPTAALQSYPGVGLVVRPLNEELPPSVHRIPHFQHLLGLHLVVQRVCEDSRRLIQSDSSTASSTLDGILC